MSSCLAVCALALATSAATPGAALASVNGLAQTPYMGVDTWYAFGRAINEQTVVGLANAMVSSGLRAAGYRYLWLDAGWWTGTRDAQGNIVVDPTQWPHGMQWLAAYIHSQGLLAGIYTDAGSVGCPSTPNTAGSYGHYQQDVDTFASWGFDAVKVDFCGGNKLHLDPAVAYGAFAQAIQQDEPRRPMLLNICNPLLPRQYLADSPNTSPNTSYTYGPATGNSWRTGPDIGTPLHVQYPGVIRNFELDAAHPEAAGPGHWNDPDYLVPDAGLSAVQARAQFTLWAILAAPLMASVNVMTMPAQTRAMLTNQAAIAIDQDPRGVQARRVVSPGVVGAEVWVRPLARHAAAVALLNQGLSPTTVRLTGAMLGFPAARSFRALDVWSGRKFVSDGPLLVSVAPGTAALLRVAPRRRGPVTPPPGKGSTSRSARTRSPSPARGP